MTSYKKKIKPGLIELDPLEPVIIVHYVTLLTDTEEMDDNGDPVVVERKSSTRKIKLKSFKATSTIAKFAAEIVEKCKFIHANKVGHVSELLQQLKDRILAQEASGGASAVTASRSDAAKAKARGDSDDSDSEDGARQNPKAPAPRAARPASAMPRARKEASGDASDNSEERERHTRDRGESRRGERTESAARDRSDPSDRDRQGDEDRRKLADGYRQKREEGTKSSRERYRQRQDQREREREGPNEQERSKELSRDQERSESREESRSQTRNNPFDGDDSDTPIDPIVAREQEKVRAVRQEQKIKKLENIQAAKDAEEAQEAEARRRVEEREKEEQEREKERKQKAVDQVAAAAQQEVRDQLEREKRADDLTGGKGKKKKDKTKEMLKLLQGSGAGKKKKRDKGEKREAGARMDRIEDYLESLYEEDIEKKIKGTAMLLQLVQDPANLAYFIESDTVLGALSRVLAEDRKKSTELVTNILEIFFCFSSFSQLHGILLTNKVGDTTMRIVDLEIKRYELKAQERGAAAAKKNAKYFQKQERLLFVCFYILLNLAEDTAVELKMKNRNIMRHLVAMLQRTNTDRKFLDELHLLIVTFLKKLSIFTENKSEIKETELVRHLVPFLRKDNEDLLEAVMRLLYNLSFDANHKSAMLTAKMMPFFIDCLKLPACRQVSVRILYNLSCAPDVRYKPVLDAALTESVPLISQFVIQCPGQFVDQELIALACNMVASNGEDSSRNIEIMVASDGLHHMIKRAHQTHDALLLKLLRNIAEDVSFKPLFLRYLHELAGATTKAQNHDFLLEAVGTLANLNVPEAKFGDVARQHNLVDFIVKHMVPGFAEDDVLLQMVMLLGTICSDPQAGPLVANPRLVRMLDELLKEKCDDVDMVLQTVYTLYKMCLLPEPCQAVCKHEQITLSVLDLVVDASALVRDFANLVLDLIMEADEEWRDNIREKRFEICNREWLDFLKGGGAARAGDAPPGRL